MRRIVALSAAWLLVAAGANAQGTLDEVVQIEHGKLSGRPRDAQGVLAFMGIPHSAAPVGSRRWQAPEAVRPWPGLRDATSVDNRCWYNVPETGLGGRVAQVPQSEDCLYLNVWTAAKASSERRPVMVWIHGGGFQFGTGRDPRTDGALLAQKGIIVVSVNYRLGVFGFFAHPQLRDQGRLGYHLAYESPYSPVASHGADLPFVFGNLVPQFFAPKAPPADSEDRALSNTIMAYWTNFAAHGDPNGPGLPHWPEFRAKNALLQIEGAGRITANPPSENQIARFKFLDGFLISASMGQP